MKLEEISSVEQLKEFLNGLPSEEQAELLEHCIEWLEKVRPTREGLGV